LANSPPFFILTLPRSRSKWLSVFLSYPGHAPCGHDLAVECDSVADFLTAVSLRSGTVETGAVLGWHRLVERFPKSAFLAVHRPVNEIHASLKKQGVDVPYAELTRRAQMLEDFSTFPGVMSCSFSELDSPKICGSIFERCLKRTFDPIWHARLAGENIQIDLKARVARLRNRAQALERLKAEVTA